MNTMSVSDEQRLLQCAKRAVDAAFAGEDPTEAVRKEAAASELSREQARRVTEAVNVGITRRYLTRTHGEKRAEGFPIADTDRVLAALYPEQVVSPAEKAAAEYVPLEAYTEDVRPLDRPVVDLTGGTAPVSSLSVDVDALLARAEDRTHAARSYARALVAEEGLAKAAMLRALTKLEEHFKQFDHAPVEEFRKSAAALGEHVAALADHVAPMVGERSMSLSRYTPQATALADEAERARCVWLECREKAAAAVCEAARTYLDYAAVSEPFSKKAASPVTAFLGGAVVSEYSDDLAEMLRKTPSDESARQRVEMTVMDPQYVAERKGLQARVDLKDFLTADEVLKHASPQQVTRAYNEIAQIAPTIAESPAIMRSWLRKSVESNGLDAFDMQSLVATERAMRMPEDKSQVAAGGKL